MKLVKLIEFLRNRLKLLVRLSIGVLILLMLVDVFLINKKPAHTELERWPVPFWSVFGFFACAIIIYASKWFGHSGIMTREDYYDE